jgi:hypothetical protein
MQDSDEKPSADSELHRFPVSVVTEFRKAEQAVAAVLPEESLHAWAEEGMALARYSFRSWEAATEYFKATPLVVQRMSFEQIMAWARWGRSLSSASPVVSSSYFRSTPEVLDALVPEDIGQWAGVGKGLYKGTWKSSSLASTYFEVSPRLLRSLSLFELEGLVAFIDALAQKSYDLASECLGLADGVFSRIDRVDRRSFLSLGAVLAQTNWRDVKPYFESGARILAHLDKAQRNRFLALTERLSSEPGSSVIGFLVDSSTALGEIEHADHAALLGMGERLAEESPAAVGEFLKNAPQVLQRVRDEQLALWFEEGLTILRENEDGGLAFFRLESGRGEQILETLSNGLALERVKDVLSMYCRALAGQGVEIHASETLKEKGIGWNSDERPATEGDNIYLPSFVERYGDKVENFNWFKVIATHQAGHLEFDSFNFTFDRPSVRFSTELRHDRTSVHSNGSAAQATGLARFFDLFVDRKLASDIFTLVEDGRVDHRIKIEYEGIREAYERVQREATAGRPEVETLPLREAIMEVLVRLSLEDKRKVSAPAELKMHIEAIKLVLRLVQQVDATIEDAAEATIRIYDIVSQLPNVEIAPEEQEQQDMDQPPDESDAAELEKLLQELQQAMGSGGSPSGEGGQEYQSPGDVEFRGDFKPELVQMLDNLRQDPSNADGATEVNGMTREELQQFLEQSVEIDLSEAQEGEINQSASAFVDNLLTEAAKQQARSGQGDQFPHIPDDDQPLGKETLSFLYDEWDFRAGDYKPRWCRVREKPMDEGSNDFFENTLKTHAVLVSQIKKQFEMLAPDQFRKIKHLPDGDEYDIDLVVESVIERLAGDTPTDKVYSRRNKVERNVAVAFLLDMSASTAEAVDEGRRQVDTWDFPDDPRDYMVWLRTRREEMTRRSYKRIIDIEKESTVLLIKALEAIGDYYGIYGFSGYGRENVEFYVIKDIDEPFGDQVKRRIDKITPMHATRMGPAIRHAVSKLEKQDSRTKILFLLSDGRPQDRGYSREGVEKEYAVHDTRMALLEARRKRITPFCLTVDRSGHDYLKTMCSDMGYEVVADIHSLPRRLPALYRRLTV